MGMRICIMHTVSSLLRIFLATISFLEFLYGILLVLSRFCFHHIVENSIFYKKDIQHFTLDQYFFQKIKSYGRWSAEKLTVKFYLVPRSDKPKILFGTRDEKQKNLFGPSNPTSFLGLCSPGDYRQSIESPMGIPTFNSTEKALTFTIYDCILRIWPKKVCYLTKVRPLDVELI